MVMFPHSCLGEWQPCDQMPRRQTDLKQSGLGPSHQGVAVQSKFSCQFLVARKQITWSVSFVGFMYVQRSDNAVVRAVRPHMVNHSQICAKVEQDQTMPHAIKMSQATFGPRIREPVIYVDSGSPKANLPCSDPLGQPWPCFYSPDS